MKNNTYMSNTQSINQSHAYPETNSGLIDRLNETRRQYTALVKENIDYDAIRHDGAEDMREIDGIVELIVETLCTSHPTVRIGGEDKPADVVRSVLMKLNHSHIVYVISRLRENTTKITDIRSYLLTSLYNASSTMEFYYQAAYNHDEHGQTEITQMKGGKIWNRF
jgi:hypothetical protein